MRKASRDASESAGTAPITKRRRESRGWGPFTGGQLTIIIVTFAVLLLLPVGAWAVSGTTVFVTDSATGKTAAVNGSRQLSVAATGSVTATLTPPNASYTASANVLESNGCTSITPTVPTGKALVVTSVTVAVFDVSVGDVAVFVGSASPGSPCALHNTAEIGDLPGKHVTQDFPMPSGFPVKAGSVFGGFVASGSLDADADIVVHGYLVSSTLCTVSGPPVGCSS